MACKQVFGSMLIDSGTDTPYSDATQVINYTFEFYRIFKKLCVFKRSFQGQF